MSKSIIRARERAARHQEQHCYYCGLTMCIGQLEPFMAEYGVTRCQATQLACTAEHLTAKADGGSAAESNIVAACAYCNRKRHARQQPLEPIAYRHLVRRRMRCGRWLAAMLPRARLRTALTGSQVPPRKR